MFFVRETSSEKERVGVKKTKVKWKKGEVGDKVVGYSAIHERDTIACSKMFCG